MEKQKMRSYNNLFTLTKKKRQLNNWLEQDQLNNLQGAHCRKNIIITCASKKQRRKVTNK